MRKILISFAMTGLAALPMTGCEVEPDDGDATTNPTSNTNPTSTNPTDTNNDQEVPVTGPIAVIVSDEDTFSGQCKSTVGADGADIDAVTLSDADDNSLGGFVNASIHPGSTCTVTKTNVEDVKGNPNGNINSGFISLGGGYVAGVFAGNVYILKDYVISVYEIGDDDCPAGVLCVGDEPYKVFVADSMNCAGGHASCAFELSSESGGDQTVVVDLTGF